MLSRDGAEHRRHREPFTRPFRLQPVRERFAGRVAEEVDRLIGGFAATAAPSCAPRSPRRWRPSIVAGALGLDDVGVDEVLGWYGQIVGAVTAVTAGAAMPEDGPRGFAALAAAIEPELDRDARSSMVAAAAAGAGALERHEVVSNAAVMLFGGIETTEGMIASAIAHLLADPEQLALVRATARCCLASSRSRCASSRPPPPSTATPRATSPSAAPTSRPATTWSSPSPRPTATRGRSPTPTRSTCAAPRTATSPSRPARTSASGCTSPGWRRTSRSSDCSTGCPA
jgi:hypothetical protein